MQRIRDSIKNDTFPQFVKKFVHNYFKNFSEAKTNEAKDAKNAEDYIPEWVVNSLKSVNINVLEE